MSSVATTPVTAETLSAMGDIGRCELIRGEIIHMAPAGAEHGDVAARLLLHVMVFVDAHNLGKVFATDTGFIIERNPDTVRAPDVAFVRKDRLTQGNLPRGFFPGPPDLAIEVVSPSDSLSDVTVKVDQWLAAGATSVWVVDPPNRTIAVYRADNRVLRYRNADELRDEPTLPGFSLRLDAVFGTA